MKKIIPVIIFLLAVLSLFSVSAEHYNIDGYEVPIDIIINGQYLKTDNERAFIENNTTFVPLRTISEAVGAKVLWDGKTKCANVTKGELKIKFNDASDTVSVGKTVLPCVLQIYNGTLYIPVRTFTDIFGYKVNYDNYYYQVNITAENVTVPADKTVVSYTPDDMLWLGKIVRAESGGESFASQLAVANVILNRVNHYSFPNTILEVIFDKRHGIQFSPAYNGKIYNVPTNTNIAAAKCAMYGANNIGNSLYFNLARHKNSWVAQNRQLFAVIGKQAFYL